MFELLAVLLFLFLAFLAFILLPILLVARAAERLFKPAIDEVVSAVEKTRGQKWRHANALERERMVRAEGACRAIARVMGAGCCVAGAVLAVPTIPVIAFAVGAYRLLKPISEEIGDACSYQSTGADDEPPYSF